MFSNSFKIILFFLCMCMPFEAGATTRDEVIWMHADFPPLRIIDGPYAGQGISDMIHELMGRELPDLRHSVITANLSRTLNWMESGRNVLAVGIIPNPQRDRVMQYSVPCVLVPPVCLVVRAGEQEALGLGGHVSLRDFIARKRLGVAAARSYGPELDSVLLSSPDLSRVVVTKGSNLFESLLEMLLLGRVDGVLAYPFEAVYGARMKGKEDMISIAPLRESMVPVQGRIAAPRTAWGTAMIGRVNEILLRHRGSNGYRQAFERWLAPGIIEDYRIMYDDFLMSR
ncbi:TIGR02285 family protein [Desulfomicrobium macestii]|nr:TIGR02285 family protein [Desulfomicrobium macestii]